jgi:probable HAF family extracellular repeat protein
MNDDMSRAVVAAGKNAKTKRDAPARRSVGIALCFMIPFVVPGSEALACQNCAYFKDDLGKGFAWGISVYSEGKITVVGTNQQTPKPKAAKTKASPTTGTYSSQTFGTPTTSGGGGALGANGTMVGFLDDGQGGPFHAFKYTDSAGLLDLGTVDPPNNPTLYSFANGVNDDGSVVVGLSELSGGLVQHAFRWTSAGGMIDLGSANGASGLSRALGVSGDGNTIVGVSDFPIGPSQAFSWTSGAGFVGLGTLGGASVATAITKDASVIVGQAGLGSNDSHAFRWTLAGGLQDIGTTSGNNNAAATAVSDNGKVVAGIAAARPLALSNPGWDFGSDSRAFRWTAATGMQDLTQLLSDNGVNLTGITLVAALAISADGQFIVGAATTPATGPNATAGFIAQVCDASVDGPCIGRFAAMHDFDGDGTSDIAWRDTSGNAVAWLLKNGVVSSSGGLGAVPTAWGIVGQRDFDGNGNTDWLWRDTGGNTAIWFLNGTQVTTTASLGNIPTNWSVVGTGDFNGDGKGDILWRDNSGDVALWLMNGGQVSASAGFGVVPLTWTVAAVGDFNGDGNADILWRDSSGNTAIWFMNGIQVVSTAGLGNVPTTWSVVGTADFNGDGMSDILWRDTGGNTAIWLMNGGQVTGTAGFGVVPTTWSIAETGDFNGDGNSDLLWRDSSGNTAIWFLAPSGSSVQVASAAGLGNISTVWTVQGTNAD